ncbi:hypothetical protein F2Q68_00024567 [Brassica cretica]|uniref:DUF4283 domain-containing protein n=1 Tax=Brassica cretica TaxID=69181 RepID=A0A8S9IBY6_BRACR|nr:hypothetical protein F2Q68_00024567 [Brassica cretica]
MPAQWKMHDRITANDLGNGKFLLNFVNEEDLQSVLRQGPFHFNFCMVVLVRWEPVVHDDYPWVIPFWVEVTGIPLHLWTIKNLRNIGNRLGHIDTVELTAGPMLIDVDTRKPLTFARKIAFPEGEEVSIQIHYDKLFKHCITCRMLTHEKASCPMSLQAVNTQGDRISVFARVQLPMNEVSRQSLLRDEKPFEKFDRSGRFDYGTTSRLIQLPMNEVSRQSLLRDEKPFEKFDRSGRFDYGTTSRLSNLPTRKDSHADGFMKDARVSHYRNDAQNYRHGREHSGYDDKYARRACGFDRKINNKPPHRNSRYAPLNVLLTTLQTFWSIMFVRVVERRLQEKLSTADDQIIDALNDMEIIGTRNIEGGPYETAMVGEDHDDDLLGNALLDMEDSVMNDAEEMVDTGSREKADTAKTEKSKALSYKSGGLSGISLGLQSISLGSRVVGEIPSSSNPKTAKPN